MISAPVTAIDVTPQSLRWCRLRFSVTTAQSPVHRPLVWPGPALVWSVPAPQLLRGHTGRCTWRWAAPRWIYLYFECGDSPGHWSLAYTSSRQFTMSKFPHPQWRAEEIKIKIWAQAWCNSNVFILLSELPWLAAQSLDNFPTHFVSLSISVSALHSSLIPVHILPNTESTNTN